ncbi:MAG: hypothetical protein IPK72_13320 [Candidatus Eisenbacteria bacterium]|nr:hypothetical protein [Candidatus Eisenbacteria bacterium]
MRRTTDGGVTWTNHPLRRVCRLPRGLVAPRDGTCFTGTPRRDRDQLRLTLHRPRRHLAPAQQRLPQQQADQRHHFLDPMNGWAYGGDFPGSPSLYRTTDGGANWSIAPQGGIVLAASPISTGSNQSVGIAVGDNRIQRTTNGGVLWAPSPSVRRQIGWTSTAAAASSRLRHRRADHHRRRPPPGRR